MINFPTHRKLFPATQQGAVWRFLFKNEIQNPEPKSNSSSENLCQVFQVPFRYRVGPAGVGVMGCRGMYKYSRNFQKVDECSLVCPKYSTKVPILCQPFLPSNSTKKQGYISEYLNTKVLLFGH